MNGRESRNLQSKMIVKSGTRKKAKKEEEEIRKPDTEQHSFRSW